MRSHVAANAASAAFELVWRRCSWRVSGGTSSTTQQQQQQEEEEEGAGHFDFNLRAGWEQYLHKLTHTLHELLPVMTRLISAAQSSSSSSSSSSRSSANLQGTSDGLNGAIWALIQAFQLLPPPSRLQIVEPFMWFEGHAAAAAAGAADANAAAAGAAGAAAAAGAGPAAAVDAGAGSGSSALEQHPWQQHAAKVMSVLESFVRWHLTSTRQLPRQLPRATGILAASTDTSTLAQQSSRHLPTTGALAASSNFSTLAQQSGLLGELESFLQVKLLGPGVPQWPVTSSGKPLAKYAALCSVGDMPQPAALAATATAAGWDSTEQRRLFGLLCSILKCSSMLDGSQQTHAEECRLAAATAAARFAQLYTAHTTSTSSTADASASTSGAASAANSASGCVGDLLGWLVLFGRCCLLWYLQVQWWYKGLAGLPNARDVPHIPVTPDSIMARLGIRNSNWVFFVIDKVKTTSSSSSSSSRGSSSTSSINGDCDNSSARSSSSGGGVSGSTSSTNGNCDNSSIRSSSGGDDSSSASGSDTFLSSSGSNSSSHNCSHDCNSSGSSSHTSTPSASRPLTSFLLAAVQTPLQDAGVTAQLSALGCDTEALLPKVTSAKAAVDAPCMDKPGAVLPILAAIKEVGEALCSLPFSKGCNYAACSNVSGASEAQLVQGRSHKCSGCNVARYCGKECQAKHWKDHRPVCKALAKAAAAAMPAAGIGSLAGSVP